METEEKKATVAYVPFRSFLTAIEGLEQAMPHQIDSSVWPTASGAIRSQLLGSFKFLGLIGENGKPTPLLKALAEDKANRKATLRKMLESSYPKVFAVGLERMTPKQFDEIMREYGMEGETLKKVSSFFLKAAKHAELKMSSLLGRRTRISGARKRRNMDGDENDSSGSSPKRRDQKSDGTSKTVDLRSGGTLTLTMSVDVFDLDGPDRDFVFGMIDTLRKYGEGKEQ